MLLATSTAALLAWLFGQSPSIHRRLTSLDGFRGYLALGVFLHHASIWYFYLRTGRWELGPSRLYTHLGHSSVALFFMITAFLFWGKLLDSGTRPVNWLQLYVSRILRLAPLYLFSVALLIVLVLCASHFELHQPLLSLLWNTIHWLAFTVSWAPDLNGVTDTHLIVAGVTWSLAYEWLFYAVLPLGALIMASAPSVRWIAFSIGACTVVIVLMGDLKFFHLAAFLAGIAAAYAVRWEPLRSRLLGGTAGAFALICFGTVIFSFPTTYTLSELLLLAFGFIIVASGNTLFGALEWRASQLLGEMGYSLYLLHGILLFITFRFVLGFDRAAALSAGQHWLIVLCLIPILIVFCYATFRSIEAPAMKAVPRVYAWCARRGRRKPTLL
ncbi:MAG: acyltransferase [Gammaproteobacteria bacterium]|nr:acyltransferase [Gammaproteobacteria bacterium]